MNSAKTLFIGLILILAGALASCGSSPTVSEQIRSIIDREMAEHNVKGVVVGVWMPGRGEWVEAVGVGNTATGQPMTVADKERIASITKSFTATVALQLIQEGRLSFDTLLSNYAPYVPLADQITIRHLLNHTSGLFTYTADATFTSTLLSEPATVWTPRQLVDLAVAHPAYCAPGVGYNYSNTNYILLGMIIEQITGHTIEDEVQSRIFGPLAMSASSFPLTGTCTMAAPYSHGYWPLQAGGFLDITEIEPSSHWTSGAIVSNVYDLRTWVEALAKGTLLNAAMQSQRLTWQDTTDPATKYGLGILKYGEFLGHDGTLPGFDTIMYHLPSHNATFVIFANTVGAGHAPKDIFKGVVELLIPEAVAW